VDTSTGRIVRVYVDREEAEYLQSEYAAIVGALGRAPLKADVYTAIFSVGRAHREEVLAKLRAMQP
jgi:hypothetical protein